MPAPNAASSFWQRSHGQGDGSREREIERAAESEASLSPLSSDFAAALRLRSVGSELKIQFVCP